MKSTYVRCVLLYRANPIAKMIKETIIDGIANSGEHAVECPRSNSLYDSTMKVSGFQAR